MAKKKTARKAELAEASELTFEQALAELESIVGQLEEGQLGLSDSLARYQLGAKYLHRCYRELREAERKIELLTAVDADGRMQTEPFGEKEMSLEEKQSARGRRRSGTRSSSPPNRRTATGGAGDAGDAGDAGGAGGAIDDSDTLF